MTETNVRDFSGNWFGTGAISGSGDAEKITLEAGEYMVSEIVETGDQYVELLQNVYTAGDDVTLKYRTGATASACFGASWMTYTSPFASLGYTQVRLEASGFGLLEVSGDNARYFINQAGEVVYLAGAHTWENLQDMGGGSPPAAWDYTTWLDFIEARGNNVFRMWAWEQTRWVSEYDSDDFYIFPNVYTRSATSGSLDGGNKFDLDSFNQSYFDRLRARVIAAGNRGMYCIVMLFNGWSIGFTEPWSPGYKQPFNGHPYNASNNINSIDGDTNDDGHGKEIEQLTIPAVTTYQKAYIAKVIDTLNDLDNVLWEIANEGEEGEGLGQDWQAEMVDYIHTYEAGKPKQHPVGVNGVSPWPESSGADWVSLNSADPDMDDPAERGATRPNVMDSDHNGGIVYGWNPFRHFCQGHGGALLMDEYDGGYPGFNDVRNDASAEYTRDNLGYVLDYAARMDLLNCTPQGALCSTGYCLRKANSQYICYQPGTGDFTLNLTEASGTFTIEWLECADGTVTSGGTTTGGATRTLTPPGTDYVAYVYK